MKNISNYLQDYQTIFWDFDGVIKESVGLKGKAFQDLIENIDKKTKKKILNHHMLNGGVSRYEKIPLYLAWSGINTDSSTVEFYIQRYSKLVCSAVINSKWVNGVEVILNEKKNNQFYVVVTATPQKEIDFILNKLNLSQIFNRIFGSPIKKKDAINEFIADKKLDKKKAIMIGDNKSDYEAAKTSDIDFILREESWNKKFSSQFKGIKIDDFV